MNPAILAEILSVISQAAQLQPELAAIVAVVQAAISGEPLTSEQLIALITARQALEAKVKAAAPAA